MMKPAKKSVIVSLMLGLFLTAQSQVSITTLPVELAWQNHYRYDSLAGRQKMTLYFEDAFSRMEFGALPVYRHRIPVKSLNTKIEARVVPVISNEVADESIVSFHSIPPEYTMLTDFAELPGQIFAIVDVIPVRLHPFSGRAEVLTRFRLEIEIREADHTVSPAVKAGTLRSVLNEGEWFKLKISSTGIHKLSYNDLQSMGINLQGIDPRNIRIHGNGGGILPEGNNIPRHDDLREMNIYISGEDDGKFDAADYILFYARGADTWVYNTTDKRFECRKNPYADFSYCFLTVGSTPGRRVPIVPVPEKPVNQTITKFTDYIHYEKDLVNLIKSGRQWYGEAFDIQTSYDFQFNLPGIDLTSKIRVTSAVVARSRSLSQMRLLYGNNAVLTHTLDPIPPASLESEYAKRSLDTTSFKPGSKDVKITYQYIKSNAASEAWLDYFTLNYTRNLEFTGPQMAFRKPAAIGSSQVSLYKMNAPASGILVWDVTDPTRPAEIQEQTGNGILQFTAINDTLREYVAFDGSGFLSPTAEGRVANQNLHSYTSADYIIISHPDFRSQADRIAAIHQERNGLQVKIVTPQEVYNEFSAGAQDPAAIRDFIRHLRKASGNILKPAHLLLIGDASYDYKDRISGNTNFIPTYQSVESLNPVYTFATDDFFGLLDDTEGNGAAGAMDICIGRLPFFTTQQADEYLNKFEHYINPGELTHGDWRSVICFVADDEDGNTHLRQADQMAEFIDSTYPQFNIDKIYMDAYQQVSTPGGQRYPEVTQAINQRMEAGTLIMNYTGHGGELGWAHERILEISDINAWKNINKLPLFITATCEFSRYDDPQRVAAGEWVFLNPNGGSIAMFTTARLTFGGSNLTLNRSFFKYAFQRHNDRYRTLGEIVLLAKQESGSDLNGKKFILLGDPALTLAYPANKVNALAINGVSVDIEPDTLKALSKITLSGEVAYPNGLRYHDFEGTLLSTVFDKTSTVVTKGNDAGSKPTEFSLRKNIVYKGQSKVENGLFSFSFIVPKDIEYRLGQGKISFYAHSSTDDAAGYFNRIVVGGINTDATADNTPPQIRLYMNELNFLDGGITDQNPVLIALLSDSSGINTVGNGIGHDIVAVLDDDTRNPVILNNYYKSDLGTYKSGSLSYPFFNLAEGPHTLRLTAWDIHNNSASAVINFTVVNSSALHIANFYNYPNPFIQKTWFVFEHNQPDGNLQAEIHIFDLAGKLMKSISQEIRFEGYRSNPVEWDGTSSGGHKLRQGMYIYQLTLTNNGGEITRKSGRLVIAGQ